MAPVGMAVLCGALRPFRLLDNSFLHLSQGHHHRPWKLRPSPGTLPRPDAARANIWCCACVPRHRSTLRRRAHFSQSPPCGPPPPLSAAPPPPLSAGPRLLTGLTAACVAPFRLPSAQRPERSSDPKTALSVSPLPGESLGPECDLQSPSPPDLAGGSSSPPALPGTRLTAQCQAFVLTVHPPGTRFPPPPPAQPPPAPFPPAPPPLPPPSPSGASPTPPVSALSPVPGH